MNTRVKDIYIVKVDGEVCSYKHGRCPQYSHAPEAKFVDFIEGLREDYPDHRLRCIRNAGIEEWLRKRIRGEKLLLQNRGKSLC